MARIQVWLCAAAAAATLSCTWSFSVVPQTNIGVVLKSQFASKSPLFHRSTTYSPSRLFESTDDDSNGNDAPALIEKEDDDIDNAKGGLLKILFISVPLFCKFCIVLMVKFLTDLVVYPLLILYRLAHLTKQRFLKLVGMNATKKKET